MSAARENSALLSVEGLVKRFNARGDILLGPVGKGDTIDDLRGHKGGEGTERERRLPIGER